MGADEYVIIVEGLHHPLGDVLGGRIQGGCLPDGRRRAEPVAEVFVWYVLPARAYNYERPLIIVLRMQ